MKILFAIGVVCAVSLGIWFWMNPSANTEPDLSQLPDVSADQEGLVTVFGYVRSASTSEGTMILQFDDAVMLSGEAAKDAAIRAGVCTEETREECTPNDFFIENIAVETIPLTVQPDAVVTMITYRQDINTGQADNEITLFEFADLISDPETHWSDLPYQLTVDPNGTVHMIEEVYIP